MDEQNDPTKIWAALRPNLKLVNLSVAIKLNRSAVGHWKMVPEKNLHEVSRVLMIPPQRLRPDLYAPSPPDDPWTVL